ncbi:uncharacterized protein LOC135225783 isoform X5 [Macrobrachium nipponense]|uniref:uncharacterized protein LOC135225783 isoform X5 n=1 Tax=Macrobrachium nipponense TaxID=159736 RepID=UPI0030C7C496
MVPAIGRSLSSPMFDPSNHIYSVEIENDEVKGVSNLGPEGLFQDSHNIPHYNLNESFGYNHNKMDTSEKLHDNEKVEELRKENEDVKMRLSNLQKEFSLLENQVHVLMAEREEVELKLKNEQEAQEIAYANKLMQYQATIAALDQCATPVVDDPPVQQVLAEESQSKAKENLINPSNEFIQKLMDRCRTLEQVNARLQVEARAQQQQYEICLDRVATQVVQALLSQKSHQEQCIKLAHQVQDLRRQNAALSSLVGYSGVPQTLPCSHRHRCPLPSSPPSFLSLPSSLTKNKQHGDAWPAGGWVASWHMEESSQRSSLQLLGENRHRAQLREEVGSSQDGPSSVTTQTTTCWYDIVASLGGICQTSTGVSRLNEPSVSDGWSSSQKCKNSSEDAGACASPTCISDYPTSKFSPLSLESETSSSNNSPEQKNCQVFQTKIDNLAFEKSNISHKKELLDGPASDKNTNVIMNNLSKEQISDILKVKGEILRSLAPSANIDSPVFACDEKNKGIFNKNLVKVGINKNSIGDGVEETSEGATRDEGYSTMSSDVQAEVKDSITTSSVTTVQEEPLTLSSTTECQEQEFSHSCETQLRKVPSQSKNHTLQEAPESEMTRQLVEGELKYEGNSIEGNISSENLHREESRDIQPENEASNERKVSLAVNTEYCDGLRVIYDEEDNNSDVFFIPIQEPENESLYRHSYHVSSSAESQRPVRCYSDSQLYMGTSHAPKFVRSLDRHVSQKDLAERTASTEEVLQEARNTRSLKRTSGQASLKRRRNKVLPKEDCTTSGSSEELWPLQDQHRKYLSPSYSHAELEDWSLDLSSEYLSGPCGEGEGSESVGTTGAHQGSLPSIQEATPDLEEDNNEFLWNGATYFKADVDLNWSSKKELTKSWQLDHSKENQTVMSPRSGCSDQPAVWSSSEQLSCCSEGVSKCSSDFENFCEQICNLPELKRVSFCSSEAGGQEASKAATPETSSVEGHEDELVDELNIDTVFTRDFYRLVKFESSKSLAASSKSLATTDGMLTIEKLQDLESGGNRKEALASMLGFIAEQQRYCQEREAQDENDTSHCKDVMRLASALDNSSSALTASMIFRGTFPKMALRERCAEKAKHFDHFSMKTLPPPLLKQNSAESALAKVGPSVPAKLSNSYFKTDPLVDDLCNSYASAKYPSTVVFPCASHFPSSSLPVSPATALPEPFVPSRSSSLAYPQVIPTCGSEVAPTHIPSGPLLSASHHPGTNSIVEEELCHPQQDAYPRLPPVPEHHYSTVSSFSPDPSPPVPRRSSSMAFPCNILPVPEHKVSLTESPPVPKRITSRALPKPPMPTMEPPDVKRPRSFIRDGTPKRFSLQELQHMARVEEEEKRNQYGTVSSAPEAVSPGDAAGLGTSWVRVQPHIDLQDPQARASLLDGMIESSEGCSSETEEDEGAAHQYSQLRSMHRSRRKRKASHRNGGGRIILGTCTPRPTVIGREDLFQRYGDKEKAALQEFEFLCDFSTSHSDLGSQDVLGTCSGLKENDPCSSYFQSNMGKDVGAVPNNLEKYIHNKNTKDEQRTSKIAHANAVKPKTSKIDSVKMSQVETSVASENGVDTSSICSVKAVIRQLNRNISPNSGMKQPATTPIPANRSASSTGYSKISSSSSTNKQKLWNSAKSKVSDGSVLSNVKLKPMNARQGNSPSSRTPSPQLRVKDNNKCSSGAASIVCSNSVEKTQGSSTRTPSRPQVSKSVTKSGSPTRIPRIQVPPTSSKKTQVDSSKNQKGEEYNKDSSSELSKQSKPCERALPPKGSSFRAVKPSPRIRTSAPLQQRHLLRSQQPNQQVGVGRSPRVARLRKTDPLDSFVGKPLCDSGSSEGSELCGGRLSLSDSCAENFSPIDSGEEVFEKES